MNKLLITTVLLLNGLFIQSQLKISNKIPEFILGNQTILVSPTEGLWSVATGWEDNWMSGWRHE